MQEYIIITFNSSTLAMKTEKEINENKIEGRLIPVPREITSGCGLAFKSDIENIDKIKKLTNSIIDESSKIYLVNQIGFKKEFKIIE